MHSRARRILEMVTQVKDLSQINVDKTQVDPNRSRQSSLPVHPAPQKCSLLGSSWNGKLQIDNGDVWERTLFEHQAFFKWVTKKDIDGLRENFENQDTLKKLDFPLQEKPEMYDMPDMPGTSALTTFYLAASSILELDDVVLDVIPRNADNTENADDTENDPQFDHVHEQPRSPHSERISGIDSDDSDIDPHFENFLSEFSETESTSSEEGKKVKKRVRRVKKAPPVQQEDENAGITSEVEEVLPKGRKRKANPDAWKQNVAKKRRNQGKSYKSKYSNKEIPKREMKPGCQRCELECTSKIDGSARLRLFQSFWALGNIEKQREYILRCTKEITPLYRRPKQGSSRKLNTAYYFVVDGLTKRVCRTFFTATLGITPKMIYIARDKLDGGILAGDLRGKHANHKKLPDSMKEDVRNHINSIPRIPSHYLRAQTEREYIEGGRTIAQIYRDYVESCQEKGKPFASRTMFFDIFNEFNISFFVPKKDQCELCVAHENSNQEDRPDEFTQHLKEKQLSRLEKQKDKEATDNSVVVCTYDLQAALPTPKGEVSSFYYRSKLSTYNLTVYDVKQKTAVCNVWHEGEGNRGANEISTCVFKFIEKKAAEVNHDIDFIFYSDNCSGQQKNKFMIMMYGYALCVFKNVRSIQHKFLIRGHTQNEGDSVHSLIEKEIKRALRSGPIYIPSQYYQLMRTAKKTAPFHVVNELSLNEFVDFKKLASYFGENFTTNENNITFTFGEIKVIKLCRENPFRFAYKTSYQAEEFDYVDMNHVKRRNTRRSSRNLSVEERKQELKNWEVAKAYSSPIPLSENKKRDLKFLVERNHIKPAYADFYRKLYA